MKNVKELFSNVRGLLGGGSKKAGTLSLAARAGTTGAEAELFAMEQLEKREYLFVLTVDAGNPTFQEDPNRPHYGTVTANFAYFLPFLLSELPSIDAVAFPGTQDASSAGGIGEPGNPGPGPVLAVNNARTFDYIALARNRMAEWLESRMAGVQITLYGRFEDDPDTAQVEFATSIQLFDLYGRDMQQRLDIGRPSALLGPVDLGTDNGRPVFDVNNNGIFAEADGDVVAIPGGTQHLVDPDLLEANADRGSLTGDLGDFPVNFNDAAEDDVPFDPGFGTPANWGDGVPDFNDGLGMIVLIQSDALTRVSMIGGRAIRVNDVGDLNDVDIFDPDTFYGIDIPDNEGAGEFWDAQGFGFGIIPGSNPPDVSGLPAIAGSVVFGAPYIRDNTDSNSYFGVDNNIPREDAVFSSLPEAPLTLNFTNEPLRSGPLLIDGVTINTPIMGIRTLRTEQAVGSINVPGLMMGTVNISGSLGFFNAQHMYGSMTVGGDLGQLYVGGTMGYWVRGDQVGDQQNLDVLRATGSVINVGGRLGQVFVAGRNRADFFVVGDTTNPRMRVEGSVYSEIETVFGVNPNLDANVLAGALNGGTVRAGLGTYRNDGFSTAEFIFSGLSGTTVSGSLGLMDPLNDEDVADFYAFAANGNSTVQFNVTFPNPLAAQNAGRAYVRVYDQDGNLIATHQRAGATPSDTTNPTTPRTGVNFEFQAPATGVYYLVVGTPGDGQFGSSLQYNITMAGHAATTFGQLVTGGGLVGSTIQVTNGAVGRISAGRFVIGGDGEPLRAQSDASGIPDADYIDSAGFTVNVPTLYNFVVGGDVGSGSITSTGVIGGVQIGGGVMSLTLTSARQLATFDVGGQVGVQETTNLSRNAGQTGQGPAAVSIRTGTSGVPGHIGRLRFGDLARGDHFTVQTSADSRIDLL
ncbi:MAG TPA: hypothetical protein VFF65_05765, partial [Phycisphaerales bacterium]|nr:hypothetical protein [Phycisphaerales bacterium]